MNMIFDNGAFVINANGQTRSYKSVEKATAVFQMMADERIGYENAHDANFEPANDDQANGVDAWFQEQEATQAALKAFDDGSLVDGGDGADVNFLFLM